ncbi:hypothetical protein PIB30_081842, partial [Stylosanthes scabra]|nr:hypothetical protein [Stylosanthes scabra]
MIRAILIHCIMNGEDVRAKEIIADKMVRMAQGIKEKGKLGLPSTIYKLCKEAGVPLREFRRTKKIPVEKPITARRMKSTRLPRNLQHQPQDNENEDQPMPQAEEGQGEEHDYQHHQPKYDHQPEFQHEPQFQQPPLYEVPTYTDQHEKDLHSKQQETYENNDRFYNQVREKQREMAKEIQQVKNYQVNQTMVESARNKALMEELAAEILDVKKHQMNTVTMGSSSSPQKYEPDQALMKIREQHANFSEVQRELKEWTRNSSARECYSVWAHL